MLRRRTSFNFFSFLRSLNKLRLNFARGHYAKVNGAFAHVPPALQRPLWQWRVIFLSKLGRSALDGLAKMKEGDVLLQAKVWSALARASSSTKAQLLSYSKALELLEKEGRPERAEFLLEYAGESPLLAPPTSPPPPPSAPIVYLISTTSNELTH